MFVLLTRVFFSPVTILEVTMMMDLYYAIQPHTVLANVCWYKFMLSTQKDTASMAIQWTKNMKGGVALILQADIRTCFPLKTFQ